MFVYLDKCLNNN